MPDSPARSRHRIAALLAGAALVACAALALSAPYARAGVDVEAVDAGPAQVRGYWTPERMRSTSGLELPAAGEADLLPSAPAARPAHRKGTVIRATRGIMPVDFEPGSEASFPQRVHGRVFFTIPGLGDASCSGTLVASLLQNVVFTAGHCVYDNAGGQWATNFLFVPGYRDGGAPYGTFPATTLLAPEEWTQASQWSYDLGVAQLATPLEAQLGARGIAFNRAPRTSYQIFGYPARPAPYDGERLIECDAPFLALEYSGAYPFSTIAYPCNMQQGASGGGWVDSRGSVTSVSSHVYADPSLDDMIVGPYFGDAAKRLYNRAGGSAQCPPAKRALAKAKRRARKARKQARRATGKRAERRTRRSVRKTRRKLARARSVRDEFC